MLREVPPALRGSMQVICRVVVTLWESYKVCGTGPPFRWFCTEALSISMNYYCSDSRTLCLFQCLLVRCGSYRTIIVVLQPTGGLRGFVHCVPWSRLLRGFKFLDGRMPCVIDLPYRPQYCVGQPRCPGIFPSNYECGKVPGLVLVSFLRFYLKYP